MCFPDSRSVFWSIHGPRETPSRPCMTCLSIYSGEIRLRRRWEWWMTKDEGLIAPKESGRKSCVTLFVPEEGWFGQPKYSTQI